MKKVIITVSTSKSDKTTFSVKKIGGVTEKDLQEAAKIIQAWANSKKQGE